MERHLQPIHERESHERGKVVPEPRAPGIEKAPAPPDGRLEEREYGYGRPPLFHVGDETGGSGQHLSPDADPITAATTAKRQHTNGRGERGCRGCREAPIPGESGESNRDRHRPPPDLSPGRDGHQKELTAIR